MQESVLNGRLEPCGQVTDVFMFFALAAVNCHDPDLSARFNHKQ